MKKLTLALFVAFFIIVPSKADAGFILEGSGGLAFQLNQRDMSTQAWRNIMITPGFTFLGEMLRAELGFVLNQTVTSIEDAQNTENVNDSDINFQLRPMLVFDPPLIPIYGRLIFGLTDIGGSPEPTVGAAVGFGMSLMDIGVFGELAALPTAMDSGIYLMEARAGGYFAF